MAWRLLKHTDNRTTLHSFLLYFDMNSVKFRKTLIFYHVKTHIKGLFFCNEK
jgi:hypothetical protein